MQASAERDAEEVVLGYPVHLSLQSAAYPHGGIPEPPWSWQPTAAHDLQELVRRGANRIAKRSAGSHLNASKVYVSRKLRERLEALGYTH